MPKRVKDFPDTTQPAHHVIRDEWFDGKVWRFSEKLGDSVTKGFKYRLYSAAIERGMKMQIRTDSKTGDYYIQARFEK